MSCKEVDLLTVVIFHPPLLFSWVGLLFLLALPVHRDSTFDSRSVVLVHDTDTVLDGNEELQVQKAAHKTSLD